MGKYGYAWDILGMSKNSLNDVTKITTHSNQKTVQLDIAVG